MWQYQQLPLLADGQKHTDVAIHPVEYTSRLRCVSDGVVLYTETCYAPKQASYTRIPFALSIWYIIYNLWHIAYTLCLALHSDLSRNLGYVSLSVSISISVSEFVSVFMQKDMESRGILDSLVWFTYARRAYANLV